MECKKSLFGIKIITMKNIVFATFLSIFSLNAFAQIDKSTGTSTVKGLGLPAETTNIPLIERKAPSLSKTGGILGANSLPDPFAKEENFKMTTDNGLLEYKTEFKPTYLKDKEVREEFKEDSYLGDFKTDGKYVDIIFRDHEFVDGDKVRVFLNDKVIINSITLSGSYRGIVIPLEKGFNRIDFVALNQGSSGPNTAEFRVSDDQGAVLSQNIWNLATGAKGTLIVVKE